VFTDVPDNLMALSSQLKMETAGAFESLVPTYETARFHKAEEDNLNHHNEGINISHNLKDLFLHPTRAFRKKMRTFIKT
jgi:hypothetical protein